MYMQDVELGAHRFLFVFLTDTKNNFNDSVHFW